jgi:hypothetical protein
LCCKASHLSQATVEAVMQQSGGHPFLAQYLLYHLWEYGIDKADETTVSRLAHRFRLEEQAHLGGWCRAIELVGLCLYSHLALSLEWWEETDLVKALEEPNLPIKRGLTALCYHGVAIHDGEWRRYRRTGELFRAWYLEEGPRLIAELIPPVSAIDINAQQELLEAHRRTLAIYLKRLARLGEVHAPPEVFHGIRDARREIGRVKQTLRGEGVTIEDQPDDEGHL